MKAFRAFIPFVAIVTLSMLAACGGGGGGGSVNPPSGGGGGGTPTPHPTSSPTASPTNSPTASPTNSPTSSPTASPTNSPGNVAANLNINQGVGYDGPVANPQIGYQNGKDGLFTTGTTVPGDDTDGDTSSGGTGANAVDNINCSLLSEPASGYHVHAFLGIIASNGAALSSLNWESNGQVFAVPDGLGMLNPLEPNGSVTAGGQITEPNANGCFYIIHTHAESGLLHFEDPNSSQILGTGANTAKYSLQNVLDVWGITLAGIGSAIGQNGNPTILFGVPTSTVNNGSCPHGCDDVVTYSQVNSASQVMFSRHSAVWLIYGGMPSGGPPAVYFSIEN